jgi:hypothetical protein
MWVLNIIEQCRPKNFQVHQMFRHDGDELIPVEEFKPGEYGRVDYYFGGQIYTHIGHWPIQNIVPRFSVPVHSAIFINDEDLKPIVCTEIVRRHAGPTQSPVSFDVYAPRPRVTISFSGGLKISLGIKWILVKKVSGRIQIQNVLGQVTCMDV